MVDVKFEKMALPISKRHDIATYSSTQARTSPHSYLT